MNQTVSIIIPTFQNAPYIARAIDSVLAQTYRHIEMIVIDDGSTDETRSVLEPYMRQNQIQYVYKENGGLSDARNVGMNLIKGTYLYFLDSDDWIEPTYIEKMVAVAESEQADIVLSSIVLTDGEKEVLRQDTFLSTIEDTNVRNFYTPIHFHPIMQNKLFRSEMIQANQLTFPVGLYYEDIYFFVKTFECAAVVARCPEAKFYYFQHDGSIMKQTSKKLLDIEKVFEQLMDEHPAYKKEKWFEYLCLRHLYFASTLRAIHAKDKALYQLVTTSHHEFINTHFPNWRQNPFLKQRELYSSTVQYMYARIITRYGYNVGNKLAKFIVKR